MKILVFGANGSQQFNVIGEAKNLLTEGELNISEISHLLGFENTTYFSRLFRKEVGITPNKFRGSFLN